ncbi:NAD-dependent epimerase/dehydratase family protein [Euzebya tangerina]|uniref:NAD-dependent epimerase/dehydratase family protein n=1 Tax=Euzebya tangerina TaxID=591198 RepID=UPI000E30EAB0|nr:NAD-dependent epimerase/dehydratase family protein [Euzebya tangerina]
MTTRTLVLGGSGFVGPAVVEAALDRGHEVSVFNRGSQPTPPGVTQLRGDRVTGDLAALRGSARADAHAGTGPDRWDIVVDTWAGPPAAVSEAVRALAGRARTYVYVSSASVYTFPAPSGSDESAPLVEGDADDADPQTEYAARKRGGELAAFRHDGPVVAARAGLILGPRSDVGRLQWWLERIARGGDVLAPGPPGQSFQYVDSRDLAAFCLERAEAGDREAYTVISPAGSVTTRQLLGACIDATGSSATLRWVSPETIAAAGITPWTELPIWLPPGELHDAMHEFDVARAVAAGLVNRPLTETVGDTWTWLRAEGPPTLRPELSHGLDPEVERRVLARLPS